MSGVLSCFGFGFGLIIFFHQLYKVLGQYFFKCEFCFFFILFVLSCWDSNYISRRNFEHVLAVSCDFIFPHAYFLSYLFWIFSIDLSSGATIQSALTFTHWYHNLRYCVVSVLECLFDFHTFQTSDKTLHFLSSPSVSWIHWSVI